MQLDKHFPRNGPASLGGLVHDAAAGANLALTMLPKAMAYAVVAGVPPVYGLYASCAAPALAIAFGSNRLLFTGPVGVMTVLVGRAQRGTDLRTDDEERGSGDEALGDRGGDRPDEEAQPAGGEQQSEDADHQRQGGGELDVAGREGLGEVM